MKHLFKIVIFFVCGLITFFLPLASLKAQTIDTSGLIGKGSTALLAEPKDMDINEPVAKLLILAKSNDIYQFFVERSIGTPDNFTRIDTVLFTTTYEDPGLQMNSIYYYRLRINTKNQYGDGWYTSNTVRLSTFPVDDVPAAPGGLEAVAVKSSQINLAWDDNSDNESYYVVIRKTGNTQTTIGTFENATEFEDTDLFPDSLYTYSVVAYNYKGFSTASNEISLKTLPDTGGADEYPAGMDSLTLMATPIAQSSTIWLFPLNRITEEQSWAVERSTGSPDNFQVIDTMKIHVFSNPYPDQTGEFNATFYYRLRYLGGGAPVYTNTTYAVTTPVDTIPDAPANLRVTAVTSRQVMLEWDDNDNEAFYTIHRKMGKVNILQANTPTDQTQYLDKELLPQTTYTYYLTAYNYKGHSLASNEVTVTTSDPDPEFYQIPDTAFSSWLHKNLPAVMKDNSSSYMITAKAAEITKLNIGETGIKDLDGLQYFYLLKEFTCNSKIQRVPDLSKLKLLNTFVATNANLSFTHLMALDSLNADSLLVENGIFSIGVEGDYNAIPGAFLLNPGDGIKFTSTALKDIHPQSVFHWYKNYEPISGQNGDSLLITGFTRDDVGYYYATVTNPLFPDDTLQIGQEFGSLVAVNNLPDWWPDNLRNASPGAGDHFMAYPSSPYLDEDAIEPGDVVGIFYKDESGELQTHAAGIWTGKNMGVSGVILGGDADGVAPKTGFEENEPLTYELWDPIRARNYEVHPEYAPVGEETAILLTSKYYEPLVREVTNNGYYNFMASNDGLFHASFRSPVGVEPDILNWSWSVVVNWKGKNVAPWTPVSGGSDNQVVIVPQTVFTDVQGEPLEAGDYLGFFFENEAGQLTCSDMAEWTGESLTLNPWASSGSPKNGFADGEELHLKVWKKSSGEEFLADAVVYNKNFDADGTFIANGLSIIDSIMVATPCTAYNISLHSGWNLVSSPVIPQDSLLSAICAEIDPVIIKNAAGNIIYAPQNGITDGLWNYKEGYQVFVMNEATMGFCGTPVEDHTAIEIPHNTYPYLLPSWYMSPVPAAMVLDGISDHFDYAQSVEYDPVSKRFNAYNFIPSHIINPPIDNIGNMKPGLAYKLRMNSSATYVFEKGINARKEKASDYLALEQPKHFKEISQSSGNNGLVLIPADAFDNNIQAGDEIAVTGRNGVVSGSGVFNGESLAITLWENGDLKDGDPITFILWSNSLQEEINTSAAFSSGSGTYESNSLQILSDLRVSKGIGEFEDIVAYPNPARDKVVIRFSLKNDESVKLSVYDLMGNQLINREYAGLQGKGNEIKFDTSVLPAGTYIYQINYSDQQFQDKLVILK